MQNQSLFNEYQLAGSRKAPNCIAKVVEMSTKISWSDFRPVLDRLFTKSPTGRPSYDKLLMVKILVLKRMYDLSDEMMEGMLYDRLSFRSFCGLDVGSKIPDKNTIWNFQQDLGVSGMEALNARFDEMLAACGIEYSTGIIIDSSFTEVPIRRKTKPEDRKPEQTEAQTPEQQKKNAKQAQHIDSDATFTKKGEDTFFGYKNHTGVCPVTKLIRTAMTTTASMHDSRRFFSLMPFDIKEAYADSAYRSEYSEFILMTDEITSQVIERPYRNTPLTEKQKLSNKEKSKTRARGEHPFAIVKQFGGDFIRTIGETRARFQNTLTNFCHNIIRSRFLVKGPIGLNKI